MSTLLNVAFNATATILRTNSYRLVQSAPLTIPAIKQFFTSKSVLDLIQPVKHQTPLIRNCSSHVYDVNTNVTKDVVLYKYENPKYFRMINIFALCQLVFWTTLSHFAFTTLRDAPVEENPEEELAWYQRINLGENKYRNGITICCFAIGYGIFVAAWLFILRSVRFLILRKGGKEVSLVTYAPFNKNRILTVPLNCISAQESRQTARVQLPLKVKNRVLFYVLDMRGEFRNPTLFDYTAGLKRRID